MISESEMTGSGLASDRETGGRLLPGRRSVASPLACGDDVRVIESCHSIWLLDESAKRFCRIRRDSLSSNLPLDWRPYDRLVLHPLSDAFVVFLDASSTRMLRSWRHQDPCARCGGEVTMEMSVDDLRRLMES